MLTLQFYTRKECSLCSSALAVVKRVQIQHPFELVLVDIDTQSDLRERLGDVIPVLAHEKIELARSFFDEKKLRDAVKELLVKAEKNDLSRSLDNYKP